MSESGLGFGSRDGLRNIHTNAFAGTSKSYVASVSNEGDTFGFRGEGGVSSYCIRWSVFDIGGFTSLGLGGRRLMFGDILPR